MQIQSFFGMYCLFISNTMVADESGYFAISKKIMLPNTGAMQAIHDALVKKGSLFEGACAL